MTVDFRSDLEHEYQIAQQLLLYVLRVPRFMAAAYPVLKYQEHNDQVQGSSSGPFSKFEHLNVLWSAVSSFYDLYGEAPSRSILEPMLQDSLDMLELAGTGLKEDLLSNLSWIFSFPEADLRVKYAQGLLEQYCAIGVRESLIQYLDGAVGTPADILQTLRKSSSRLANVGSGEILASNPYDADPDDMLSMLERLSTGVSWLDEMLKGGLTVGDAMGVLLPSGVGKTTLCWQLTNNAVSRGQKVVLLSFEQPVKGDLAYRAYVLGTDTTRDDWIDPDTGKARLFRSMPQEVQDRWKKAQSLWVPNLKAYADWENISLSSTEILTAKIDELISQNWNPTWVFLDWWGALKNQLWANLQTSKYMSSGQQKAITDSWLKTYIDFIKARGLRTLVFHQVRGAVAGRQSVQGMNDAQGDRDFPNFFDYCLVGGSKDREDVVEVGMQKGRSVQGSIRKVKVDGKRCRIVGDTPDYGITWRLPNQKNRPFAVAQDPVEEQGEQE